MPMDKPCYSCGKAPVEGEEWKKCPSCGEMLCPECAYKSEKERKELERLRDGDAHSRIQILCPSCSSQFYI